jgi:endonuclease YncB( thermonuclease family)
MLALSLAASAVHAREVLTGTVIGVHDGDTLTLAIPGRPAVAIRLADIDAPELGQPFGKASKESLSQMCFGQSATVTVTATDRSGRKVGRVTCGTEATDVSAIQMQRGMAWAYRQYLTRLSLLDAERVASAARVGLWSGAASAPWEWRASKGDKVAEVERPQAQALFTPGRPPQPAPAAKVPRSLAEPRPPEGPSISLHGFLDHHKSAAQAIAEQEEDDMRATGWTDGPRTSGSLGGGGSYGGGRSSHGPIQTGPRGGRYYINSSGNKQYVPRGKR